MTFKIDKTILQNALTQLNPFLEKKDIKAPTSNYFLKIDNCILTLCATDYNFSLKLELTSIYDSTDGEFLVNGNSILSIIKRLKGGEIEFNLKGDELEIKQGRSKLKLQTLDTNTYPQIEIQDDTMQIVNIDSNKLFTAIKKCLFAVAVANPKYELNSMLFNFTDTLNIAATDTRCLSVFTEDVSFNNHSQILVPRFALIEMQKIILTDCELLFNDTYLKIKSDNLVFTTKLISGKFPDYKRVIPSSTKYSFKVPTTEIIEAIKIVTATEDLVKITFSEDNILIESGEGKLINSTEIKLVQKCNESIYIKVSANQFLNALGNVESELFDLGINDHNLPFTIKDKNYLVINMPYIEQNKGE